MKYNIIKTIFGAMMLSLMFLSFECGEDDDMWVPSETRSFCFDNHTYDTIDILMTNSSARASRKTITSRPFSTITITSYIVDDTLTHREAIADFLGGWDTVRLKVKGVERALYYAPVTDSGRTKSFFNLNSWENSTQQYNRHDTKFVFKVRAADLE